MEFHLAKHVSKIAHINLREEKHGEEPTLAVDVKVSTDVPNDFLSYLKPTLKWSMYEKKPGQGDLLPDDGHLPHLRHPELGEMRWKGDMARANVMISSIDRPEDVGFDADVDNLKLDPKDGGTVSIAFRLQLLPTDAQAARLVGFLGKEVRITVRPQEPVSAPAE